jgi:hypothetical protein
MLGRITRAAGEQIEPLLQAGENRRRLEGLHARRRELDGQWETV